MGGDLRCVPMISKVSARLPMNRLESSRRVVSRTVKKRLGRIIISSRHFYPISSKSGHSRMGKGKGNKLLNHSLILRPGSVVMYVLLKSSFDYSKLERVRFRAGRVLRRSAKKLGFPVYVPD